MTLFDLEESDTNDGAERFGQPSFASRTATQGIKYAGSKLKMLPSILRTIEGLGVRKVWDAFSGTTRVSQALAKSGYVVESNDIAVWSEQFAVAYLQNRKDPGDYSDLIGHLNNLQPVDGWFSREYGGIDREGSSVQSDGLKRVWQLRNTQKLDAIREEVDRLDLDRVSRAVALTSLVQALDRVDSTMGHYVSYLREWAPRAYNPLQLQVPLLSKNRLDHTVTRRDVLDPCGPSDPDVDLSYLDPPYGSNNEKMPPSRVRYESYYHLWTTVIKNDQPQTFGAARRREDSSDTVTGSVFEEFRANEKTGRYLAVEALDRLISRTQTPWILLSYSSGGRATATEIDEVLRSNGELISTAVFDYKKNVMAGMTWTNEWLRDVNIGHQEFLFLLKK